MWKNTSFSDFYLTFDDKSGPGQRSYLEARSEGGGAGAGGGGRLLGQQEQQEGGAPQQEEYLGRNDKVGDYRGLGVIINNSN